MSKKTVVFVCTHNSARSQMAEGLLRHLYGDQFEVYSAGIAASQVKPMAVEVMEEIGVDMSSHTSKDLSALEAVPKDYVVTVCDAAHEACPYVPARIQLVHKGFPPPSAGMTTEEEKRASFRMVRDAIKTWLENEFVPMTNLKNTTP